MTKMSIPMVWPDEGACKPGQLLEVCAYSRNADDKWERENLDAFFFAWLMKLKDIKGSPVAMAAFKDASTRVLMHINLRAKESDKLKIAYQLRENDEKTVTLAATRS